METPVLVVGAGPAGLIASLQLAKNNQPCILAERSLTTTKWPKMDITNARSMELLQRLGIAQDLRDVGVPGNFSFNVNFSTGLSEGGELVDKWDLDSPDKWRTRIREQNDGSMPSEPYQRCSQAIFEAWLKPKIQAEPLIDSKFGWKFVGLTETEENVRCEFVDVDGETHFVTAKYVIACDGAGSRVRQSIGIPLTGGPVPTAMLLIHFKSTDLARLQHQGQFWHIFFTSGSFLIAQDEKDTWTMHTSIPLGTDISTLDPRETIYRVLGGHLGPHHIDVDEILVTSSWRPNICLADRYISKHSRVFLAGDAAHQNIPTGGYGMNTALGDSFDIAWKIAAVLAGYGGKALLRSYEDERRPVAARNIDQSGVFWSVHEKTWQWCAVDNGVPQNKMGDQLRERLSKYYAENDLENKAHGLELGYRYNKSPVINFESDGTKEPSWNLLNYVPSTWPGVRAPHVYLKDGRSIFTHFGKGAEYTLIDFSSDGQYVTQFEEAAKHLSIPLKLVSLPDEAHARRIWERDAVLIRPDDFVAWRSSTTLSSQEIKNYLLIAVGQRENREGDRADSEYTSETVNKEKTFAGTVGNIDQDHVEMRGDFQK